jgi:TDG/mug DNA glycosylase family protein
VERATVAIYETRGETWAQRRRPERPDEAEAFADRVAAGAVRADLGCGAGRYTEELGEPVVALDAARTMLGLCRTSSPGALLVQADLEALPLRRASLGGAWASMSYLHVPSTRLPLALGDLHRSLAVGAPIEARLIGGPHEGHDLPGDDIGGRYFASWEPDRLADVATGAGFAVAEIEDRQEGTGRRLVLRAERARTLADTVGPGMRLLVCGLNPSVLSADAGVGFARPGNRFWPAAVAAGAAARPRDPLHALREHGMGMTDIVKRATVAAAELDADEYVSGIARVQRLCAWLRPRAICFVGLTGWRAAVDRRATPGPQPRPFGGVPAYVMPSTSGLNAHTKPAAHVEHLRAALALADSA